MPDALDKAHKIRPWRGLLAVLAAALFVLGWLSAHVVGAVVVAGGWVAAAVRVGWADARSAR